MTHPFQYYRKYKVIPVVLEFGYVLARGMLRAREVRASTAIIRDLIGAWRGKSERSVGNRFMITVSDPAASRSQWQRDGGAKYATRFWILQ